MLTEEQVLALRQGQTLYSGSVRSFDGRPSHVRITSIRIWKTRPHDAEVRWKHGLYTFGSFSMKNGVINDQNDFFLTEEEAKKK